MVKWNRKIGKINDASAYAQAERHEQNDIDLAQHDENTGDVKGVGMRFIMISSFMRFMIFIPAYVQETLCLSSGYNKLVVFLKEKS